MPPLTRDDIAAWVNRSLLFWQRHGGFPLQSRIHRLRGLQGFWLKRDDELGFGVSGCKRRKFASLLPHLIAAKPAKVIWLGSAGSTNILAATQLCREVGLPSAFYLLAGQGHVKPFSATLTNLLANPDEVRFFYRQQWPEVLSLAEAEVVRAASQGEHWLVIPEGSCHAAAIPGLMTLGLDLLRNESETGVTFKEIVIDAGTGLTAQTLLAFFSLLGCTDRAFHVISMAVSEAEFAEGLNWVLNAAQEALGLKEAASLPPFTFHRPATGRSFGAVNKTVLRERERVAKEEGVLVDPLYMAKVFYTLRQRGWNDGPKLVIHSGANLSYLAGLN